FRRELKSRTESGAKAPHSTYGVAAGTTSASLQAGRAPQKASLGCNTTQKLSPRASPNIPC
ncbi:hypothetical protein, partial [Thermogutta sp.]|uniref:hypothetical protein n=1 Tax=Thermogutta sp. TaxID=1962930 RepID=UPI0025FA6CE9